MWNIHIVFISGYLQQFYSEIGCEHDLLIPQIRKGNDTSEAVNEDRERERFREREGGKQSEKGGQRKKGKEQDRQKNRERKVEKKRETGVSG